MQCSNRAPLRWIHWNVDFGDVTSPLPKSFQNLGWCSWSFQHKGPKVRLRTRFIFVYWKERQHTKACDLESFPLLPCPPSDRRSGTVHLQRTLGSMVQLLQKMEERAQNGASRWQSPLLSSEEIHMLPIIGRDWETQKWKFFCRNIKSKSCIYSIAMIETFFILWFSVK